MLNPFAVQDWGPSGIIDGSAGDLSGLILITENKIKPIDNWQKKISNGMTWEIVDNELFNWSYMMPDEIKVFRYLSCPSESQSSKKDLNSRLDCAADKIRISFDKFYNKTFNSNESFQKFIHRFWCRCLEILTHSQMSGTDCVNLICENL